ncbi:MAG: hypothetical protein HY590_07930 [Candidatus Omnitrophica bacterium]|nr:hypothetical protein [Candidatus Omnitrophota bacterium]
MIRKAQDHKDLLMVGLVVALFLFSKLPALSYDLFTGDEGINLHAFWKASRGELVYRDFSWHYGPLTPFIFGTLFNLLGVSVQGVRLVYIFVAAVGVALAFWIARSLLPPFWSGVASFMAFSALKLPPHSYNHIFGTLSALWVVAFFFSYLKCPEGRLRPFLIGIGAAIGLLTKPLPMGFGIFISVILFVLIHPKKNHFLRDYLLGVLCLTVPVAVYFSLRVPFNDLVRNIYPMGSGAAVWRYRAYPYFLDQRLWTSLAQTPSFILKVKEVVWHVVWTFLWWMPVVCAVIGFLFFRKQGKVFFLSLFSVLIYLQPLITGSDGIGFLLQVPFILLAYFFYRLWQIKGNSSLRFLAFSLKVGIAFFIGYFLLFSHYVKEPMQRAHGKVPLSVQTAHGIRVTPAMKEIYEGTVTYVTQQTMPGEKIFVGSPEPIYYFLCQRDSFLKDEFMTIRAGIIDFGRIQVSRLSQDEKDRIEEELIRQIKQNKPKCIILTALTYFPYTSHRRKLFDYIEGNYVLGKEIGDPKAFSPAFKMRGRGGYFPHYGVKIYKPKENGESRG